MGADFFSHSFAFREEGADINATFRMRSGYAALDWFPFGGRFRLSPLVVFGNNNQVRATALIPAGSSLSLSGQDYISSYTDPLHGSGSSTSSAANDPMGSIAAPASTAAHSMRTTGSHAASAWMGDCRSPLRGLPRLRLGISTGKLKR
jgi:hypothetical protein